jgi:hypothetical protein
MTMPASVVCRQSGLNAAARRLWNRDRAPPPACLIARTRHFVSHREKPLALYLALCQIFRLYGPEEQDR